MIQINIRTILQSYFVRKLRSSAVRFSDLTFAHFCTSGKLKKSLYCNKKDKILDWVRIKINEVNELYLNPRFHTQKRCLVQMILCVSITSTTLSDKQKRSKTVSVIYRQNHSNYNHKVECLSSRFVLLAGFYFISD